MHVIDAICLCLHPRPLVPFTSGAHHQAATQKLVRATKEVLFPAVHKKIKEKQIGFGPQLLDLDLDLEAQPCQVLGLLHSSLTQLCLFPLGPVQMKT
jgi:hypothetical protein